MRIRKEKDFLSFFDQNTGKYFRTGIMKNETDTGTDPFMASFPELLDVGIMGHCIHGQKRLCVKTGNEYCTQFYNFRSGNDSRYCPSLPPVLRCSNSKLVPQQTHIPGSPPAAQIRRKDKYPTLWSFSYTNQWALAENKLLFPQDTSSSKI